MLVIKNRLVVVGSKKRVSEVLGDWWDPQGVEEVLSFDCVKVRTLVILY